VTDKARRLAEIKSALLEHGVSSGDLLFLTTCALKDELRDEIKQLRSELASPRRRGKTRRSRPDTFVGRISR